MSFLIAHSGSYAQDPSIHTYQKNIPLPDVCARTCHDASIHWEWLRGWHARIAQLPLVVAAPAFDATPGNERARVIAPQSDSRGGDACKIRA